MTFSVLKLQTSEPYKILRVKSESVFYQHESYYIHTRVYSRFQLRNAQLSTCAHICPYRAILMGEKPFEFRIVDNPPSIGHIKSEIDPKVLDIMGVK